MSPLDVPLSLAAIGLSAGAVLGFLALAAVCELVARWRRGR